MAKKLPPQTTSMVATAATTLKVRAIRDGYYDHVRRREGDVFLIDARANPSTGQIAAFSSRWMERAGDREPERVTSTQEAIRRQHTTLIGERTPGQGTSFADESTDNPLDA